MRKYFVLSFGLVLISNVACLKTRSEINDAVSTKNAQTQQVAVKGAGQETNVQQANSQVMVQEFQGDLRQLNGRIESLEHQMNTKLAQNTDNQEKAASSDTLKELLAQMKIFDQKILAIEARIAAVESRKGAAARTTKTAVAWSQAEGLFSKKNWKKAIVAYQKYRDSHPKGKYWASATYKIGVCFQELRLTNEAKSFFEEVLEKRPNTSSARKAKYRLNQLKKKST